MLSRTQQAALSDLRTRDKLWPLRRGRMGSIGSISDRYSRRTLDALVEAGLARWESRPGVMEHVVLVPTNSRQHPAIGDSMIFRTSNAQQSQHNGKRVVSIEARPAPVVVILEDGTRLVAYRDELQQNAQEA